MKMRRFKLLILFTLLALLIGACGLANNFMEGFNNENLNNNNNEYQNENNAANNFENNVENENGGNDSDNTNEDSAGAESQVVTSGALEITSPPADASRAFQDNFSQYVNVFGVGVYGSSDVPAANVMHAASIMAEYLDNNEDGVADNPAVVNALTSRGAALFMFNRPESRAEEDFLMALEESIGFDEDLFIQPLYGFETTIDGAARGEFDATYEEVLHLLTAFGWAFAYPDVFGEVPGTELAEAMDIARGGHFESIPTRYPDSAWYSYDDETCEYNCMMAEYIYWGLTTLLGAQDIPGRAEEIGHEWRFTTPAQVKVGDPGLMKLLTDPQYGFPTRLPDGNYTP